jgi:hypothetical protein
MLDTPKRASQVVGYGSSLYHCGVFCESKTPLKWNFIKNDPQEEFEHPDV